MRAIFRSPTKVCARAARVSTAASVGLALLLSAVAVRAETNRIVIRVNDRIATLHDYETARFQLIEALRRSDLPPEQVQERLADVGLEVMSDLLEEMLLLSRGDQIDAEPTREDLDAAVLQARDNAGIDNDEEFGRALAASGFTMESFREHLGKNLTMQGVMGREVRPRIRMSEEDLRRYYQANLEDYRVPPKVNVREFVVLDTATSLAEDRMAIADSIRERLAAGEDPDALVAEFTDKGLTTPWIDVGWVSPGDLDPALEAVIWDLEVGVASAGIPARGGVHVCQVLEREEATVRPFAEVAEEIEQLEANRRYGSEMGDYLAELERNSYVVIDPPPEAASFRSVIQRRREQGLEFDERESALAGAALPAPEPGDSGSRR